MLLERFLQKRSRWPAELEWAQRISARVAIDPQQTGAWLATGAARGGAAGLSPRWFAAVRARVEEQRAAANALTAPRISVESLRDLRALLIEHYPSYDDLAQMLELELDRTLASYSDRAEPSIAVDRLIRSAEAEDWSDQLLAVAQRARASRQADVPQIVSAADAPPLVDEVSRQIVYVAFAEGEEALAEQLAAPLRKAGYEVEHGQSDFREESIVGAAMKALALGLP